MKLQNFDGGLNIRLAPELIQTNEAITCLNADLSSGQLKSSNSLGDLKTIGFDKPYFFESQKEWLPNGDTRDYLDWQNNIYYTDGVQPKKRRGNTWYNLGIEKPSALTLNEVTLSGTNPTAPSVALIATPLGKAGLIGDYLYYYANHDPDTGETSLQSLSSALISPAAGPYGGQSVKVSGFAATTLPYRILYRQQNSAPYSVMLIAIIPSTDTEYNDYGDTQDIAGLTEWTIGPELQYVYTYYNSEDGTESIPSEVSAESSNSIIFDIYTSIRHIQLDVIASTDPQVTNIRLYRIGDGLLNFSLVKELPNVTQTYTDRMPNRLIPGTILSSEENYAAPSNLRFLIQHGDVFLGAVGSKLYYSKSGGNANYWPPANYIEFHSDITGIGKGPTGSVITTGTETYGLSGTDSTTFVKYHISQDQGCINSKTMVSLKGALFFLSTDGLCTLAGGRVEVLSKSKLGKQNFSTINAVVYDEAYYCQMSNKTIICFDFRYTPSIRYLNFGSDWLVVANDTLYCQTPEAGLDMQVVFAGSPIEFEYRTGNLAEGVISELKNYNTIYVACKGNFTFNIYIDDTLVTTRDITSDEQRPIDIAVPQDSQRGTTISFGIKGIGTIQEIEYQATRRENVG